MEHSHFVSTITKYKVSSYLSVQLRWGGFPNDLKMESQKLTARSI